MQHPHLRIRPELPAQVIQQLPSIQNLLLHLEGKGRKPATILAYKKNLEILALRSDLKKPLQVELAIARYIKKNKRPATTTTNQNYATVMQPTANTTKSNGEASLHTRANKHPTTNRRKMSNVHSLCKRCSLTQNRPICSTGLRPCEIQGEFGLEAKTYIPIKERNRKNSQRMQRKTTAINNARTSNETTRLHNQKES